MSPKIKAPSTVKYAELCISKEEAENIIQSNLLKKIGQIHIIEILIKSGCMKVSELVKDFNASQSSIKTLQKNGYLKIYDAVKEKEDNSPVMQIEPYPAPILNDEQKNALACISDIQKSGSFGEVLLHGVTASGKTEVYLHAIEEVINKGGNAILLVPEIALTPQMIKRFLGRFGNCAAILHSRLTESQKYNEWMKIKNGKVSVAIGARSAVFAPFEKVDLIIVDEEQEPSYKSDEMSPRYHACEIAAMRGKIEKAAVVYGSATPRISTYYRAQENEIKYVKMKSRANKNLLPDTYIVDMREDSAGSESRLFGRTLISEMKKNIENKEQTVLFVQRRGFSKQLLCRGCGKAMRCASCNIAMTYHSKSNRLICHYCGNTSVAPKVCPACKSSDFEFSGFGTERVEEEIKRIFLGTSVVRMDTDTTAEKDGHEKLISSFANGADFLVGTQMIAKGLDFPNVTLVGIVSADGLINMQEYSSSERAFQLMAQVAGRAGRSAKPGRAVIQAYNVDDYTVQTAAAQDYESFYRNEITARELLNYPPFCKMAFVNISCMNDRISYDFGMTVFNKLKQLACEFEKNDFEILRPARQPVSKVNGWYRWRVTVKAGSLKKVLNLMNNLMYNISGIKKKFKVQLRTNIDILQ